VLITPFLPRIFIQAKLRITELISRGNMDRAIRKDFTGLLRREIKYETGTPRKPHISVANTAILIVRRRMVV
jgi:hypothetical protein